MVDIAQSSSSHFRSVPSMWTRVGLESCASITYSRFSEGGGISPLPIASLAPSQAVAARARPAHPRKWRDFFMTFIVLDVVLTRSRHHLLRRDPGSRSPPSRRRNPARHSRSTPTSRVRRKIADGNPPHVLRTS